MADLSAWYEKEAQSRPKENDIAISTLDNPGWRVRIRRPHPTPDATIVIWGQEDDEDWLDARFRESYFDAAAGREQLGVAIMAFFDHVAKEPVLRDFKTDPLYRLQQWYASRCDGEWEHEGGVRLSTTSTGWELELHLYDGYWPEPRHKPPVVSVLSRSQRAIVVSGPTEGIEEFMETLHPLKPRHN